VSLSTVDGKGPVSFPPPPVSMMQRTYTQSGTNNSAPGLAGPAEGSGRRTLVVVLLAAIVVALVSLLLVRRWRAEQLERIASSAARSAAVSSPSAAPPPTASAQTQQIVVRITAFPLTAKILLDGRPLDSNPYVGFAPPDQVPHRIDAQAVGYAATSSTVTFNHNVEVVLTLVEDKTAAPPKHFRYPPKAPPKQPPDTPRPPTRSNCDPPFYVDDRGVKKFKPGCY
jgi:hypothetical protein